MPPIGHRPRPSRQYDCVSRIDTDGSQIAVREARRRRRRASAKGRSKSPWMRRCPPKMGGSRGDTAWTNKIFMGSAGGGPLVPIKSERRRALRKRAGRSLNGREPIVGSGAMGSVVSDRLHARPAVGRLHRARALAARRRRRRLRAPRHRPERWPRDGAGPRAVPGGSALSLSPLVEGAAKARP